jgi:hypothetical protein
MQRRLRGRARPRSAGIGLAQAELSPVLLITFPFSFSKKV